MSVIDEQIEQLQSALDSEIYDDLEEAVKECISVCSFIPDIKTGLDRYRPRAVPLGSAVYFDYKGDAKKLIGKLRAYQERTAISTDKVEAKSSPSIVVNNSPVNNVSAIATASSEATLSSAMSNLWSIPDSSMSAADKQEIASLLSELNAANETRNKHKILEAAKKAGAAILEKGIAYAPQLMPFIMQAIEKATA